MARECRSPTPSRIRRAIASPVQSPASPASTCGYPEDLYSEETMPIKVLSSKSQALFNFFVNELSTDQLDAAEQEGCLFHYKFDKGHPYARDPVPLKRFAQLLKAHLEREPLGMFAQSEVQPALQEIKDKLSRPDLDKNVAVRLQAFNYLRMFRDLHNIKNSSTTGARLAPHVKIMLTMLKSTSDR